MIQKNFYIKQGSWKFESRSGTLIDRIGFVYGNVESVQHGGTGGWFHSCNWKSDDKVLTVKVTIIIAWPVEF